MELRLGGRFEDPANLVFLMEVENSKCHCDKSTVEGTCAGPLWSIAGTMQKSVCGDDAAFCQIALGTLCYFYNMG